MKHRTFRRARAAALASLLVAQGPLVQLVRAGPAAAEHDGFAAFLDKFWQEAWGSEFILNQSGLLLQERAPGVSTVQASDGTGVVAQGTWFEILRLEEPQLGGVSDLAGTSDLLSFDHAVTAGVLLGSTGSISPAFGMAVTVAFEGLSGRTVVEGFTPFGLADDAQGAIAGAYGLHAALGAAQPVLAGDEEPPLTEDPCRCQEKHDNDVAACTWKAAACVSACFSTAVIAIAACASLGPLGSFCAAAVITAYLACAGACAATQQACMREAANDRIDCQEECEAEEDSPDTGPSNP